MTYLKNIHIQHDKISSYNEYPFNIDAIKSIKKLELHPKVTFIIGNNGIGKSTIIEALAISQKLNPEGGSRNFNFSTNASHSCLHKFMLVEKKSKKFRDAYFYRAESFYNLSSEIERLDRIPAAGPPITPAYGGTSLHQQSHGESFWSLMKNRFFGNGLYILDVPEAALSPMRQMSMLSLMHQLINKNSQFIISTHSPILMAYPDSIIYELTDSGVNQVQYEDTEHYCTMKDFINHKDKMLKYLLAD